MRDPSAAFCRMAPDLQRRLPTVILALSLCLASAQAGGQTSELPVEAFVDRIEVTAVELMIDVRDPEGLPVRGLGPEDFQVREDGEVMEIVGVDDPPSRYEPEPLPGEPEVEAGNGSSTWRTLIYFDLALTQKRSLRRAVETLKDRIDDLTALGPVELVVANPQPRVLVPFSRDPKELRQALGAVEQESSSHLLAAVRRDFLHMLDQRLHLASPGPSEAAAVLNAIRTSVNKEFLILNRRLITLGQWMGAYGHAPASAAILVSDGFDLDPSDFYLAASSLPGAETELDLELNRYRVDPLAEALARELAARGWTSVVMALGGGSEFSTTDASLAYRDRFRSIGEPSELSGGPERGSPTAIFQYPLEPLRMVAEKTGGEVMTARKTAGAALGRIGERLRLTYLARRAKDGQVHRVEVTSRNPGLKLNAPQWVRSPTREQIAAARARRLLVLGSDGGEMPVRLTISGMDRSGDPGTRRTTIEIFFDLNALAPVLPRPQAPLNFTFGVQIPEAPPLAYSLHQAITPPAEGAARPWPEFLYTVALDMPDNARRLSVVVEDPASGMWGGSTHDLRP